MKNPKSIRALFAVPGFTAASKLVGVFGDRYACVVQLQRRKKQPCVRTADIAAGGVELKVALDISGKVCLYKRREKEEFGTVSDWLNFLC